MNSNNTKKFKITIPGQKEGYIELSSDPLGKGGEGSVYPLLSISDNFGYSSDSVVAKIYHNPSDESRLKIEAMISNKPSTDSAAWPIALVCDEKNQFLGFIMKKLSFSHYKEWSILSNASSRKKEVPGFDFRYALTSSANLGIALDSIHRAGHFIGDINESNIFVSSSARIMLVDTDSAHISSKNSSKVFRCGVGKAEYTAPELTGGSLREKDRTLKSDSFAYSVAVWQMLTGGYLPTDGVFRGEGDPPSVRDKIKMGIYPTIDKRGDFSPPPSFPLDSLPTRIHSIIKKGLSTEPSNRATVKDILAVLKDVLANLERCSKNKNHYYDKRDGDKCPWCLNKKRCGIDPWGKNLTSSKDSQISLPSVKFSSKKDEPIKNRTRKEAPKSLPSGNYREPQKPKLIKGKTVINYGGIEQARPSLKTVFRSNAKLGFHCINNETPWIMRFWWSKDQLSPNLVATLMGVIIALIVSYSFVHLPVYVVDTFSLNIPSYIQREWLYYFGLSSFITSALLSFILFASSVFYKMQQKKLGYRTMSPLKNISRYIFGPIFWGPIFGFIVLILVIFLILNLLISLVSELIDEAQKGGSNR